MNPVLQAIAAAALDATGGTVSWVLALEGERLRAVAAAGERAGELVGTLLSTDVGAPGYVVSSGQPIALATSGGDPRLGGGLAARLGKAPTAVLCVPCLHDEAVVGALELVDKAGGKAFSYDDVELVTLLGGIAGAALSVSGVETAVRPPAEFSSELAQLAGSDPVAYARLSVVLEALLARG